MDSAREIEAIAIGGSAGGFEAMLRIAEALPADLRAVVLLVLHLPPERPSAMAPLLGQRCALPVTEALDKQPAEPGTVVCAPPDYHLLVEPERTLALSLDAPVLHSRPAIDPLFESAAAAYGAGLLAVLLTGASADGSAGLAAVRRAGGLAWVQSPADARAPTMPAAALQRAGADAVLTLQEICARLARAEFTA